MLGTALSIGGLMSVCSTTFMCDYLGVGAIAPHLHSCIFCINVNKGDKCIIVIKKYYEGTD